MAEPPEELLRSLLASVEEQGRLLREVLQYVRSAPRQPGEGADEQFELWRRLGLGEGERRRVTVLFADVSGFTAMAETMDPEECSLVMRDTLATLAEEVRRQGGHTEKFIGDAVCALYGAPEAHDDEPERAARAALAMHRVLAERAARRPDLPALSVHVGINTGLVVAGPLADGSQFGAMGDTINTAARLMDRAKSGQTFVSAETARRLRRHFELEHLGDLEMEGRAAAVPAFRLVRELRETGRVQAHELHGPLVGRDAELRALRHVVEDLAAGGPGRAVLVWGESGSGKTRLLNEFAAGLEPGVRLLRASIREAAGEPGGPLAAALAPLCRDPGSRDAAALTRALTVASTVPLAVLLDEMEAADPTTIGLVRLVILQSTDLPVLWVLAARPEAAAVRTLLPGGAVLEVVLRPLSPADAATLVRSLVPGALSAEQATEVAARLGGNPEFTEEWVLEMIDEGILVEVGDGSWRLAGDLGSVKVPSTVHDLIETRVDGLPDTARAVLQEASIIGERFRRAVLEEITALPAFLDSALGELVSAELIRPVAQPDAPDVFVFRGPLVHHVVSEGILRRRRAEFGRRVSEAKARAQNDFG